jgi:pyridoxine 4-dehydrogenase
MDSGFLTRSVECSGSRQPPNLGLDVLDVVNLRSMSSIHEPAEGSIEAPLTVLAELQKKGLVRHIGLINVTPAQIAEARQIAPIVCIQNHYNLARRAEPLIADLVRDGIAYEPFFPLGGFAPLQSATLSYVAARLGATPMQVALAWLPQRSPKFPGDPRNIFHSASSREPRCCEAPDFS